MDKLFDHHKKTFVSIAEAQNMRAIAEGSMSDFNSVRHLIAADDRFYVVGMARNGSGSGANVPTAQQLTLQPFIAPRRLRLKEIGWCKTGAGGSDTIRFGLYRGISWDDLRPGPLLFAGAAIVAGASGFYTALLDVVLEPNVLYYPAVCVNVGSGFSWAHQASAMSAPLGYARPTTSVPSAPTSWTASGITGALPDPFPFNFANNIPSTSNAPMIMVRMERA